MRATPISLRRIAIGCAATLAAMLANPLVVAPLSSAAIAQRAAVSIEFRLALEPYGEFRPHRRWGEVWVPVNVGRDWRPYTVGRWVYTEDYGWYWDPDEEEAAWGWVVYHYGRWAWDDDLGWVWVPGRVWGPAWVDWRRGSSYIGWAPLPPDEIIVEVREEPRVWIFVEPRNFLVRRIAAVVVRPQPALFRETVVVNRTVLIRERNFAVNPGIAPAIVAAQMGRPVQSFDVRPRVFAGTAAIRGAEQVRADDLRRDEFRSRTVRQTTVRQADRAIRPAARVPQPQGLGPNEAGRLGEDPPRAAVGTATERQLRARERDTTGAAPERPGRPGPKARERDPERGPTGAAPERPAPPERGLREREPEPERGTTGAAPERPGRPEPKARERGPERGATGAAPERPAPPERGLREREPERGTTGAAPERPGRPEPAVREQGRGTAGSAPNRGAPGKESPGRAGRGKSEGQREGR
jgi:hypothetical protein